MKKFFDQGELCKRSDLCKGAVDVVHNNALHEVMTAAEAAVIWDTLPRNVQRACTGGKNFAPRFTADEARRAGRIWLVTAAGMDRVFGPKSK